MVGKIPGTRPIGCPVGANSGAIFHHDNADDDECQRDGDFERSRALAQAWGSRFIDAGNSGHINADAGFGPWPLGENLLAELTQGAAASSRRSES